MSYWIHRQIGLGGPKQSMKLKLWLGYDDEGGGIHAGYYTQASRNRQAADDDHTIDI